MESEILNGETVKNLPKIEKTTERATAAAPSVNSLVKVGFWFFWST